MADQVISPLLAAMTSALAGPPSAPPETVNVGAAMPPGPQTSPVQQDHGNNPVGQMTPMSQVVNTNPAQQPAPQRQGPPVPRPILLDAFRVLKPEQQPGQIGAFGVQGPPRPASRLDHFENFLSNFLNAVGSGMSEAHGRGAFAKGFGAAVQAPYQRAVQQYQLGQQAQLEQSQLAYQQAQTARAEEQATMRPRWDPNDQSKFLGVMSDNEFASYLRGAGKPAVQHPAANYMKLGENLYDISGPTPKLVASGEPKPEKLGDQQQFIQDWLKSKNLPPTPNNRLKAFTAYNNATKIQPAQIRV